MKLETVFRKAYEAEWDQWRLDAGMPGKDATALRWLHTGVRGRDFPARAKTHEEIRRASYDALANELQDRCIKVALDEVFAAVGFKPEGTDHVGTGA